jgi:hypothetical protein
LGGYFQEGLLYILLNKLGTIEVVIVGEQASDIGCEPKHWVVRLYNSGDGLKCLLQLSMALEIMKCIKPYIPMVHFILEKLVRRSGYFMSTLHGVESS